MKKFPKPYKYNIKFPEKYVGDYTNIVVRSSWEKKMFKWCDDNPSVLKWGSEICAIPYWSQVDEKMRRYFIDLFVQMLKEDGTTVNLAIEIKPNDQIKRPVKGRKSTKTYVNECLTWTVNQNKWDAAREWCSKNNFTFVLMDEYALGIKKLKL
ncbi:MAG: TnsA endonuclease N-terminal domain-containing protein [Bacteroidales bacterium]|jgi:hypothetical protein